MNAKHRFNNDLRYRDGKDKKNIQLTPAYVMEPVRDILGEIELDPCTQPDNPTRAKRFYALPIDGLAQSWDAKTIWCNPPYGKAREPWVDKCIEAAEKGYRVVLLMPAHTETRCFQKAFAASTTVVFINSRLKFGILRPNRRQVEATHPSALFGFNVDLSKIGLGVTARAA